MWDEWHPMLSGRDIIIYIPDITIKQYIEDQKRS